MNYSQKLFDCGLNICRCIKIEYNDTSVLINLCQLLGILILPWRMPINRKRNHWSENEAKKNLGFLFLWNRYLILFCNMYCIVCTVDLWMLQYSMIGRTTELCCDWYRPSTPSSILPQSSPSSPRQTMTTMTRNLEKKKAFTSVSLGDSVILLNLYESTLRITVSC